MRLSSVCALTLSLLANAAAYAAPRVAVVGAGVGGAFTATFLEQLSQPDHQVDIDIFEAQRQAGGRVQDFSHEGEALELGASIFWDQNLYVKTAAQRLGLRLRQLGGRGKGRQDAESGSRPLSGAGAGEDTGEGPSGGTAGAEGRSGNLSDGGSGSRAAGHRDGGADVSGFAVWNGSAFAVNMTGSWSDKLRAVLRYGTAALRYKWLVSDAFRRFKQVYDLQAAGAAWDSPEGLLHSLGLYNETQQRCSDYMRDWLQQPLWWLWGGAAFADEVAGAANRCNYNQNNDQMNAFAGLVSYMPAAYGAVWQIEGGNRQLVSGLLAASGARLLAEARVTAVRRRPEDGLYDLIVRVRRRRGKGEGELATGADVAAAAAEGVMIGGGAVGEDGPAAGAAEDEEAVESLEVFGPYDAVVIAAPLVGSDIEFDIEFDLEGEAAGVLEAELQRPYQVTVTTYVAAGRLRAKYFGVERMPPVARLFVTSAAEVPFSSVAVRPVGRPNGDGGGGRGANDGSGPQVYKIFSREELPQELLEALFESDPDPPRMLTSRRWYAYPRFQPPERFSPFMLAPGLVYGNALEAAASALEIAAIGAHNSAALVVRHLKELREAAAAAAEATKAAAEAIY